MSNISVSVTWEKPTVFAGEDIECRITFTNTAQRRRAPSHSPKVRASGPGQHRRKATLPFSKTLNETHQVPLGSKNQPQTYSQGHRAALSLGSRACPKQGDQSNVMTVGANGAAVSGYGHKHKRTVSIISIGVDLPNGEETHLNGQVSASQRPARNHGRAASLQVLPRRISNTSSVPETDHVPMPSPFFRTSTSTPGQSPPIGSAASPRVQSNPITALDYWTAHTTTRKPSGSISSSFKFPHASTSRRESRETYHTPAPSTRASASHSPQQPRPEADPTYEMSHQNPMTRVISPANNDNTPRSSTDFYSMSNNSTETLASEYIHQSSDRLSHRSAHGRRPSHLTSTKQHKLPETLMLGYAQIIGSFTLDGSLINQAPFEDVKRRGVLGGQSGGGVVGLESNTRDSGLFGALGWSNFGESLGGLLGGSELSSIKEIKDNAKSKSIPIITTPQSILFVDLRLEPGESKSYTYSHPLPRSIPPSYRGRAIKISYNLVIGTQRPKTTHQQHHLRHVDIPFRVLPGVNSQGDVLGHDLMAPYIILQSEARTSSIDGFNASSVPGTKASALNKSNSSFPDFLSYSEKLFERGRQASSQGLLSPTDAEPGYGDLSSNENISVKDAVDLAILSSNSTLSSNRGANRFEIARNGLGVAIIMLARPAYRLGESISAVIDFSHSDFSCYSLYATLETSEQVDSAIALRSSASISRITRRVYGSLSENTLFGRRAIFCPTIPLNATPGFLTSGVSLEWNLRFEFVTSRAEEDEGHRGRDDALLEEVASDERGTVSAAVPELLCESFDVTVPLKVYGATAVNNERIEVGNLPI